MELKVRSWSSIDAGRFEPAATAEFVVGQPINGGGVVAVKKGCIIPWHSHHSEQFTLCSGRRFEVLD